MTSDDSCSRFLKVRSSFLSFQHVFFYPYSPETLSQSPLRTGLTTIAEDTRLSSTRTEFSWRAWRLLPLNSWLPAANLHWEKSSISSSTLFAGTKSVLPSPGQGLRSEQLR